MDQPANALEMLRRFVAGEPMAGEPWTPGCCGDAVGEDGEARGAKAPTRASVATA